MMLILVHQILVRMEGHVWLKVGWLNVHVLQKRLAIIVLVCEYQIVQDKSAQTLSQNVQIGYDYEHIVNLISRLWSKYFSQNVLSFTLDDTDFCASNPCQKGGTCTPMGNGGFTCNCPVGATGDTCGRTFSSRSFFYKQSGLIGLLHY